jgi:hypothetical protein
MAQSDTPPTAAQVTEFTRRILTVPKAEVDAKIKRLHTKRTSAKRTKKS